MKPRLNIGMIGHVDHRRTTATAAIVSATANRPACPVVVNEPPERGITINTAHVEYEAPEPLPPRRSTKVGTILAVTAMLAGGFGFGLPGGPSAASIRHDSKRPKTDADLERMEAAQRKRDRKAARKGPPNAQAMAAADTQTPKENGRS
jgi:hypothetical protein